MRYIKTYEGLISKKSKNQTLDDVFSDCKPYLDLIKKCDKDKLLVRGVNEKDINIAKFETRDKRNPIDTPHNVHAELNDLFEDKFGWKVRNGVFCYFRECIKHFHDEKSYTFHKFNAGYGQETYFMFPIGEFDYCWSKDVYDLFNDYEDEILEYERDFDFGSGDVEMINILISEIDTYVDVDICKATLQEISINCDSYYLVSQKYMDELIKRI